MPLDALPETDDQRQARHLGGLRKLGDLAMALATASAEAALAEIARPPEPEPTPAPRRPDYPLTFFRASRAVRDTFSLERRIADGRANARRIYRPATQEDPRRPLLQKTLQQAVGKGPGAADRRREVDATIDDTLRADPAAAEPIAETLESICRNLGLKLDYSRVPDALLGLAPVSSRNPNPADPKNAAW